MTTERPDHYAVLGVDPSATQAEITHAYRALVRHHHPDTRARGDESDRSASDATLQHVLLAYAVLGDSGRRAAYDRETRPATPAGRREPRQQPNRHAARSEPPIVVGPVRWHRSR